MQTPPIPPVTHWFGNGLGQERSTPYLRSSGLRALPSACEGCGSKTPSAMVSSANIKIANAKFTFFISPVPAKLGSGWTSRTLFSFGLVRVAQAGNLLTNDKL